MPGQMPAHKAIAIAAVLLLHLVLLWLFLRATVVAVNPPPLLREQPITIWLRPTEKPKPPVPEPEEKKKKQGPPVIERTIGPPLPVPGGAPPAEEYNGLRALGRYLNNCSNANYEALSERELAHCLGNRWQAPGEVRAGLGLEAPSEWKVQLDKKKAPPRKVEHECDIGTRNSNLGLPCFDFGH